MSAVATQAGANGGSAAGGASGQDLLVVGPGVLGSYVGRLWLEAFPGSTVVGQTNTASSHERWVPRVADLPFACRMQGCSCRRGACVHSARCAALPACKLSSSHRRILTQSFWWATIVHISATRLRQLGLQPRIKAEADGAKFPFVLFAAPPSGSEDYPTEVLAHPGRPAGGSSLT